MKEATGELSTTAIAIVAIGLVLAIFTTILLPIIRTQITLSQACNSGPGYAVVNADGSQLYCEKDVKVLNDGSRTWNCQYTDKNGKLSEKFCTD